MSLESVKALWISWVRTAILGWSWRTWWEILERVVALGSAPVRTMESLYSRVRTARL